MGLPTPMRDGMERGRNMEALTEEEMNQELKALTESRQHIYSVLSHFFETEITKEYADEFVASFDFESDNDDLNTAFERMRECLSGVDEHEIEELAVVFDRVFFGMGPRTAHKAFPYESVYTSVGGRMNQEAWTQVKALYRAAGFEKNPDFKEPEDHIAVQLAFMSEVCSQIAAALEAHQMDTAEALIKKQDEFIDNHFMSWINPFFADVQKATDNKGFYSLLAIATQVFIGYDQEILHELMN